MNNKQLTIRECQLVELEMMKKIHEYCNKHKIQYSLSYGTLIGAIRHKGFIPWDNDMDICMLRADFERFKKLVIDDPIDDNINIFSMSNKEYHYSILRASDNSTSVNPTYLINAIPNMGCWVDIFPVDGFNKFTYLFQRPLIWINTKLVFANTYKVESTNKLKYTLQRIILKVFPDSKHIYERNIDKLARMVKDTKSKKVAVLVEPEVNPLKTAVPRMEFKDLILAKFEDTEFYIPRNARKHLTAQYGDFMKIPDEKDRITHDIQAKYIRF